MAALRAGGVRAVSRNGVLGNPAGASAAEGAHLLDQLAADLAAAVAAWYPGPPQGQAAGSSAPRLSEQEPSALEPGGPEPSQPEPSEQEPSAQEPGKPDFRGGERR